MACKFSQSLKGVIMHNARGWDEEDQSQNCKPRSPLQVLLIEDQVMDAGPPDQVSQHEQYFASRAGGKKALFSDPGDPVLLPCTEAARTDRLGFEKLLYIQSARV